MLVDVGTTDHELTGFEQVFSNLNVEFVQVMSRCVGSWCRVVAEIDVGVDAIRHHLEPGMRSDLAFEVVSMSNEVFDNLRETFVALFFPL